MPLGGVGLTGSALAAGGVSTGHPDTSYSSVSERYTRTADPGGLLEALAAIEHDQWMTWARSVLSADDVTIGPERLARWQSYMVTYADLPDAVKEHDRVWARSVLAALTPEATAPACRHPGCGLPEHLHGAPPGEEPNPTRSSHHFTPEATAPEACGSCGRPYADEAETRCGWCGALTPEATAPDTREDGS